MNADVESSRILASKEEKFMFIATKTIKSQHKQKLIKITSVLWQVNLFFVGFLFSMTKTISPLILDKSKKLKLDSFHCQSRNLHDTVLVKFKDLNFLH